MRDALKVLSRILMRMGIRQHAKQGGRYSGSSGAVVRVDPTEDKEGVCEHLQSMMLTYISHGRT